MSRPPIPSEMMRALRKEAHYGCVMCGCPVLEYHHIKPYSVVKTHEKDNLVAVCPNCHTEIHDGHVPLPLLYKYKNEPENALKEYVSKRFNLWDFKQLTTEIANTKFSLCHIILEVNGKPLLYYNVDENGHPLLNSEFYNTEGKLIAEIKDNTWKAYINNNLWDIVYSGKRLKINYSRNQISLEIYQQGDLLRFQFDMSYGGSRIIAKNEKIVISYKNLINDCTLENCSFVGVKKGIVIFENGLFLGMNA